MTTLKEAREALDYLQGRIDAGSMAGERLAVIDAYLKELVAATGALMVAITPITEQHRAERRTPRITVSTGTTPPTFDELRDEQEKMINDVLKIPVGALIEMPPEALQKLRESILAYAGAPK